MKTANNVHEMNFDMVWYNREVSLTWDQQILNDLTQIFLCANFDSLSAKNVVLSL